MVLIEILAGVFILHCLMRSDKISEEIIFKLRHIQIYHYTAI